MNNILRRYLIENICFDPSLELSQQDGSNDGTQHMFHKSNMENYPFHPFLSEALTLQFYFKETNY